MFIQVRLLKGYSEPLLYKIPLDWESEHLVGNIIKVPLRNRKVLGIVEKLVEEKKTSFDLKYAISIEPFPKDITYLKFINKISYYYQASSIELISRIQQFILKKDKKNKNFIDEQNSIDHQIDDCDIKLTEEQENIYNFLKQELSLNKYSSTLMHGVTGSGKTEVYKKIITHTIIEKKKSVIFLIPEVTLAIQFEQIFKATLKKIKILSFHSSINTQTKKEIWHSLLTEEPILIIGVHLPILLPIANLGLIIVDEEHEVGYQEKKHPKINSKEGAILKAQIANIPILLGSATPSINSIYNIKHRNWNFFQMKNRFNGAFPNIKIVRLKDKKQRKNFWISKELEDAINDRLNKKEQTIIFLNRRGYSFFVQCNECNFVFKCKSCSVSLTLHQNNWLYCHYCSLKAQYPDRCMQCKIGNENFLNKGIGTEQVVKILKEIFLNASIARADLDTTSKKKEWNNILNNFKERKIDILVGTQTITKGYHFPNVTLVGILWADLNLHFPIYNASETTLQQLIQVAGRAGRQSQSSDVIIQTMIDHEIYENINEINYLNFYNQEIVERKKSLYPPFIRLIEIELKNSNELILENEAKIFANEFNNIKKNNLVHILGPVKPLVSKLKNKYIQKIYIKTNDINDAISIFEKVDKKKYKSKISFTPNPTN